MNTSNLASILAPRHPIPLIAIFAVVAASGLGCTSMKPFEQVRREAEGQYLSVGGRQVHALIRGSGEPLLLLHGFGGSTYSWRQVQPRLAERYRTIALDLHGFGYTERPRAKNHYTRSGQVQMILGALDALGIDSTHVMGHSYGGGLSLTLAALHPERVRSLVLVDSTAPSYANTRRKAAAAVQPLAWSFVRGVALRPRFVRRALERSFHEDSLVTDDLVEAYRERLRVRGAARAYRGLTAPQVTPEDRREIRYEDIEAPTLVVWGRQDQLIDVEDGRTVSARIPGRRFVAIDDCGHAPMEEKPEEFLQAVLPFLAAQ